MPDDITAPARGTLGLRFGAGASPAVTDGTVGTFTTTATATATATGSVAPPATSANGDPAAFTFIADFGRGAQTVTLSLGQFGQAQGLTQYSGTELEVRNRSQDGVLLGAFAGLAMRDNGDVAVNYDNGQSRVIAHVPLVAFNDPEKLQRLDGLAFMRPRKAGRHG